MRILALDVGRKRIGVAVSDPLGVTARPHSTIERGKTTPSKIAGIVKELNVDQVVIGLPLHLSGVEGEQARDVRSFAAKLSAVLAQVPIDFWDERLTTLEAQERLSRRRMDRRTEKGLLDAYAAALILESYLSHKK